MPLPVRNIFFSFKLHCDYSSLLKVIKCRGFFENRIEVQREQKKIRSLQSANKSTTPSPHPRLVTFLH